MQGHTLTQCSLSSAAGPPGTLAALQYTQVADWTSSALAVWRLGYTLYARRCGSRSQFVEQPPGLFLVVLVLVLVLDRIRVV